MALPEAQAHTDRHTSPIFSYSGFDLRAAIIGSTSYPGGLRLISAMLNFFGLFLRACKTAHTRNTHGRCQQCGTSSVCSCAACPPHPTRPCAPHETAFHPVSVCHGVCARASGRESARRATRSARGQYAADRIFSSSTANSARRVDHGCRRHHTTPPRSGMHDMMALSAPFAL